MADWAGWRARPPERFVIGVCPLVGDGTGRRAVGRGENDKACAFSSVNKFGEDGSNVFEGEKEVRLDEACGHIVDLTRRGASREA
jgi:hypothetical protein